MAREHVVEGDVVDWAEKNGWLAWKLIIAGVRGSPDRWFFKDGRVVIMEFKKIGEHPEGQQLRRHRELAKAGHTVHIVRTFDEGVVLLS
jgi:hypothetical protein